MRKPRLFGRTVLTILAAVFALAFLLPTLLTISNSFMTQTEISANYGQVFDAAGEGGTRYVSEKINLKFILMAALLNNNKPKSENSWVSCIIRI